MMPWVENHLDFVNVFMYFRFFLCSCFCPGWVVIYSIVSSSFYLIILLKESNDVGAIEVLA